MSTSLWKKHQYAKCFGHWCISDPECIRCAVSDNCEKRTKTKVEEKPSLKNKDVGHTEVDPVNYLLSCLKGKFDYLIEERGKSVLHKYLLNDKVIVAVVIGSSGKIKIINILKQTSKICGSIPTIEDAEKLLKELI